MKNNVWVFAGVILFSTLAGMILSVIQNNSPVMHVIVMQQNEAVKMLRDIHEAIAVNKVTQPSAEEQKLLFERMASIERKLDALGGMPFGVQQAWQQPGGNVPGPCGGQQAGQQPGGNVPGPCGGQQAGQQQPSDNVPQEDYSKVYEIPVDQSPVRGPQKAPVTLVAFVDFQCPFSARFHPVINEVMAAYPKDVNFMVKHFPLGFHAQAKPVAKAVLAAGEQGKYWEMVDAILKDNSNLSDQKTQDLAKALNLNMKKFTGDISAKGADWDKLIDKDTALGNKIDVRGTPTFYINGRKTMSRDLASFKNEIDEILKKK